MLEDLRNLKGQMKKADGIERKVEKSLKGIISLIGPPNKGGVLRVMGAMVWSGSAIGQFKEASSVGTQEGCWTLC